MAFLVSVIDAPQHNTTLAQLYLDGADFIDDPRDQAVYTELLRLEFTSVTLFPVLLYFLVFFFDR